MYKFVSSDIKTEISKIENDLKTVNGSSQNIERLVQSVTPAETTQESVLFLESYLNEDGDSVKFKDDENKPINSGEAKSDIVKDVTTYMKVSTDILSAKMKVLRNIYACFMKSIKHCISPQKEEDMENITRETPKDKKKVNPEIQVNI
jgi:hypothetical protein